MCVTVLYPRNTKKSGRRKAAGEIAFRHSHSFTHVSSYHCRRHRHHLSLLSFVIVSESLHKPRRFRLHVLSTAALCGYGNDYIVYSPDYVIPIAQNGKKSLTHEWMAETSGWDSERKEHQFISLELSSISLVSSLVSSPSCIFTYIRTSRTSIHAQDWLTPISIDNSN